MKKNSKIMIAVAAVLALVLAVWVTRGYIYTRVATKIVNDEAEWDLRDASPSMQVLLLKDGPVARFVSENDSTYVGEIQDVFEIAKTDAEVETWYACDGKGVVYLKDFGTQPVYSLADESSAVVGQLCYEEGFVPDTYRCAGFKDGWFAVDIDGCVGYVKEDKLDWDAIDSF